MNAIKILKTLLIAASLSATAAQAADGAIQVAMEGGKQVAQFKLGDSRCVLKDDQIRCVPLGK